MYSYLADSPLVSQITFAQSGTTRMTTTKQYDYLNRLTSISSANASATVLDAHGYAYNSANQRTRTTNADGTYWVYQYDALGQVVSGVKYWSDGTLVAGQQFGYAFDTIGNRTDTTAGGDNWGQNTRSASYTANTLNQYTSRTVPGAVDITGTATNSATVTVNNQPATRQGDYYWTPLAINNASSAAWQPVTNLAVLHQGTSPDLADTNLGHVFLPQSPEAYTYDLDGNLTQDGRWTYAWDSENRLIEMTSLSTAPAASLLKLDFAYDAKGRRIEKIVSTNDGSEYLPESTNLYVYDGWNLVAEVTPAGSLIRGYTWGLDLSGSMQGAGGVGGLLEISYAGSKSFTCYDGNGNVTALVNASNSTVSANYEYGPFGEVIRETGAMAKPNPIRFSTKYQDDESDYLYYGYRFLNTSRGRWLSRDPVEEDGGINLYVAEHNEPIDFIDGLGKQSCASVLCGLDVTAALDRTLNNISAQFWLADDYTAFQGCTKVFDFYWGSALGLWDIRELKNIGASKTVVPCGRSITFKGGCYFGGAANYSMWGRMFSLCGQRFYGPGTGGGAWNLGSAVALAAAYKVGYQHAHGEEEAEALAFTIYGYSGVLPIFPRAGCAPNPASVKNYAFHWKWIPIKPRW